MEHNHRRPHSHDHDSDRGHGSGTEASASPAAAFRAGRAYKVRGLDCAEEVAVLKQVVGPLVGGADRLAFDVMAK
jgi:Cd2+/Zn2+-exporting ATPase